MPKTEKSINKAERPVCGCGAETEHNDFAHHPDCPCAGFIAKQLEHVCGCPACEAQR